MQRIVTMLWNVIVVNMMREHIDDLEKSEDNISKDNPIPTYLLVTTNVPTYPPAPSVCYCRDWRSLKLRHWRRWVRMPPSKQAATGGQPSKQMADIATQNPELYSNLKENGEKLNGSAVMREV